LELMGKLAQILTNATQITAVALKFAKIAPAVIPVDVTMATNCRAIIKTAKMWTSVR